MKKATRHEAKGQEKAGKEERTDAEGKQPNKKASILTRFTRLFVLFALLLVLLISVANFLNYQVSMLQRFGNYARGVASIAARFVSGEELIRYAETGEKDEEYYDTEQQLAEVCRVMDVQFLYVMKPISETESVYIYDVRSLLVEGIEPAEMGAVENTNFTAAAVLEDGIAAIELSPTRNEYGYFESAYAPVTDEVGNVVGYVGVDIDMAEVTANLLVYLSIIIVLTILFVVICFSRLLRLLRKRVLKPITKITEKTEEFVQGGIENDTFEPLEVATKDEIGTLATSINQMFNDIQSYTKSLAAETASRQRTSDDLKTANSIQQGLLPKLFPPYLDYTDVEIYAEMYKAQNIGSDFYDCFPVDRNHIAFVVADVEGNGISAALYMMVLQTLIKNRAVSGCSPREVLESINRQLCESNEQGMSARVFLGIYNAHNNVLSYVNAGHHEPIIKRANGAASWLVAESGQPLGLNPDAEYNTQAELMNQGDCLLLYTSGVTEATNPLGQRFGNDTLLQLMKKMNTEVLVPQQVVKTVGSAVLSFTDQIEQVADITLMLVRRL